MFSVYQHQPLTRGIPMPKPPSKSTHNQENKNPLLVSSKVKISMSTKLPSNFFESPGIFNLPQSKAPARRAISLPKLEHRPVVRSDASDRMMSSNMFGNRPDLRVLERIKINNFIPQEKRRLVL